ncbi:MAG: xanthine dehydrogenase family protein molybdopterin-binding subunit [Polaromonas sp.]|uniref:xanthine dehydrogenase family protein molybdopterin-binding subunit n=1 Tax=Polaromonas sp. TaxID=1869339 RepID=UPI0026000D42|nr:molybdopterin cofactor-binding domain-containing protein [Polaromonas sp.]MBI2726523.1 xanthine dehydrogenase family protein molybdopterin-binding subunit [Polaromonas sp.]
MTIEFTHDVHKVSRRNFLLSSGAITVGVAFGPSAGSVFAQGSAIKPNAWIQVGSDGIVTIYSPGAEMGQGVRTAMPLLVAEDMDLDWSKVKVLQAPADPKNYGNVGFGGAMITGASRTTRGYYEVLRIAGHQAREVMRFNAAKRWAVPISEVSTEPHFAVHASSKRRLSYGEIAAFAEVPADFPKSTREQLKPASQFRLIGKNTPRIDIPEKVLGKANYGIDVSLPGMVYASILRAPVQGEKPERIDDTEAKKIAGVKAVVPLPYGVAVVAETYWVALKARNALKVEWSQTAKARTYSSEAVLAEYRARSARLEDTGVEHVKVGDPEAAFKVAHKVIEAQFTSQHVAHACMEPMNCTAQVTGDRIEIWAPSQSPSFSMGAAGRLGFPPEKTTVNLTLLGGGFGRRTEQDYTVDAVLVAKALPGVPVKVLWTREDDIRSDKYRPMVVQHLTAAMDEKGKVTGLRHRMVSESINARLLPPAFERGGGRDPSVCDGAEAITYGVPNRILNYLREQRGVDVGFWRAVGPGYTKFAIESMMDELALAAKQDEVTFRLNQLSAEPKAMDVIKAVANMAGWTKRRPAGRALGIAYSDAWEAHVAQIAEVSVDRKTGRIRVHDVWCAVDPGIALQPHNIAVQMESSIMYGLSALLGEKVILEKGVPQASNFHDYPLLRMNEAPRVHVKVLPSGGKPSGIGEVGLPPIAPAVASAVFKLTGKRLRDLPFDPAILTV